MIQLNLLPDVKQKALKAKHIKRLVMLSSFIASAAAVSVVVLLGIYVFVFQRDHLNNLDDDIAETTEEIENISDINRMLTVQNQLGSLTSLHEDKPKASRFLAYIDQVAPGGWDTIEELEVDFLENRIIISGEANSRAATNEFVDILKFSVYVVGKVDKDFDRSADGDRPFSNVVLSDFGVTQEGRSYTIDMEFDPKIFDNTEQITFLVPEGITTRSITDRHESILQSAPLETDEGTEEE